MDNHLIINDWIKVYMIGPMEQTKANDAGVGWRDKIEPELKKRTDKNGNPIFVFNPCSEEQNKVGMEEGDVPCGTFGEAYLAFINKIPIYVLQTMPREKYPVTFTGWVFGSGGDFFKSQSELLEFIDKKYSLKVKG